jgi:hypothetical protein
MKISDTVWPRWRQKSNEMFALPYLRSVTGLTQLEFDGHRIYGALDDGDAHIYFMPDERPYSSKYDVSMHLPVFCNIQIATGVPLKKAAVAAMDAIEALPKSKRWAIASKYFKEDDDGPVNAVVTLADALKVQPIGSTRSRQIGYQYNDGGRPAAVQTGSTHMRGDKLEFNLSSSQKGCTQMNERH